MQVLLDSSSTITLAQPSILPEAAGPHSTLKVICIHRDMKEVATAPVLIGSEIGLDSLKNCLLSEGQGNVECPIGLWTTFHHPEMYAWLGCMRMLMPALLKVSHKPPLTHTRVCISR